MVAQKYKDMLQKKSVIRTLSEFATKRGQEIGYENVFDYSLGNPSVPVVQDYTDNTIRLLQTKTSSELHGYSPSVGLPSFKEKVAASLNKRFDMNYTANHIFPTSGAAGALAHALRAVTSPGDDVLTFAPYFPEYNCYVGMTGANIRDNMKWGKEDATEEEIQRALSIAQASDFVNSKPEGLNTMVSQGGANLSGGQRQRLTIARALVGDPEILIMDDSASALDFATDAALRHAIHQQTRGMTVFIVSQRATSIKQADKILVLDDGELVGVGTHKELMESCEVYREICLSQLSEQEVNR